MTNVGARKICSARHPFLGYTSVIAEFYVVFLMIIDPLIERVSKLLCWRGDVAPEPLTGGITNRNFLVRDDGQRFVVRLGADIPVHGILRWHEVAAQKAAYAADIAPRVHHHEDGVLVMEHIGGKTLTEEDLRQPDMLIRVVSLLAKSHREVPKYLRGPVLAFWVFQVIRNYAATLREGGSVHIPRLNWLLEQADLLQAATSRTDVVFGHNDMLAANIIDDGTRLWLLDWEYSGVNTPLFDLAGIATNNELSEDLQQQMLVAYHEFPVSNALWRSFCAMKCASLMRETMWSMVSEIHSDLDFDYAAYTAENATRLDAALVDFQNS